MIATHSTGVVLSLVVVAEDDAAGVYDWAADLGGSVNEQVPAQSTDVRPDPSPLPSGLRLAIAR